MPVGVTDYDMSHKDAVYTARWVGKTGTEFFTGSQDGYMKWWDIRNFSMPTREFLVAREDDETNPENGEGVNCLSMQAKAGANSLLLGGGLEKKIKPRPTVTTHLAIF